MKLTCVSNIFNFSMIRASKEHASMVRGHTVEKMFSSSGKPVDLPFAGFISPPHFAWSPPEVYNSIYGLNPDPNGRHHPGTFNISPVCHQKKDVLQMNF